MIKNTAKHVATRLEVLVKKEVSTSIPLSQPSEQNAVDIDKVCDTLFRVVQNINFMCVTQVTIYSHIGDTILTHR